MKLSVCPYGKQDSGQKKYNDSNRCILVPDAHETAPESGNDTGWKSDIEDQAVGTLHAAFLVKNMVKSGSRRKQFLWIQTTQPVKIDDIIINRFLKGGLLQHFRKFLHKFR